jgi:hypothetical protein
VAGCAGQAAGDRSAGPRAPAPPERLFLAGDGELRVVDVETGGVRILRWPQLAPGDPPYRIVRRGDELVFYGGDTYAAPLDLTEPPRRIGRSWFFVPSAAEDRVWLAILDRSSPPTVRSLAGVREIAVGGRTTTPRVRPPGGRWPVAAVRDGLVVDDGDRGLEVWNPRTRRAVLRLPSSFVAATYDDTIAWCDEAWGLHVTDVASRSTRRVPVPRGFAGFDCFRTGAFSPDGASLAVPLVGRRAPAARRQLGIVDLATGAAVAVPGSSVRPGYVFVTWSASGDEVFLTGGQRPGSGRQIVAYRLGAREARRLAVPAGSFYGIAAS